MLSISFPFCLLVYIACGTGLAVEVSARFSALRKRSECSVQGKRSKSTCALARALPRIMQSYVMCYGSPYSLLLPIEAPMRLPSRASTIPSSFRSASAL